VDAERYTQKSLLENFLSDRNLLRSKEYLHEFVFAADNHIRKTFEPFVVRHFRLAIEPICKQSELICRNFARTNSVEKMIQQSRRRSAGGF
jgi:hypothetical protein